MAVGWACTISLIVCSLALAISFLRTAISDAHALLSSYPQPLTYEELTAPLADAARHSVVVRDASTQKERTVSVLASPAGQSGRTLVLVHAFKMSALTWSPVWNELRNRGHQVLALDLAGHGQSNLSKEALELVSLSSDIRHVLDHFDVRNGGIVGHSLGGFLAMMYLVEHASHALQRVPLGFACLACTGGHFGHFIGGAGGNWHGNLLMTTGIEDAHGESPRPPAFLEAPLWATAGPELGQTIGPVVPRVGLERLRGTRGAARRGGGGGGGGG
ncbi:unnamed protein product, partial [Prorocentrum cordatum]